MPTTTDWNPVLRSQFREPYWQRLQQFIASERAEHEVYPPQDQVFAALQLTALADTRIVILGQDPYHGPGQAHGLSFSVPFGQRVPPSLKNIYKELQTDVDFHPPRHGNLEHWAAQGVLLLNTVLTVQANRAASHRDKGWEQFTDQVIAAVDKQAEPVVFLLWGNHARAKRALVDTTRHRVLEAPHPSPLSAHRGFLGCRHFSQANDALTAAGRTPIDWRLPD